MPFHDFPHCLGRGLRGTGAARQALTRDWPHFFIVEVTQPVVERAGEFAETFALRGYDSVQLAAACEILSVVSGGVAFSCFDNRLNKAARARVLGLDVAWPTSG